MAGFKNQILLCQNVQLDGNQNPPEPGMFQQNGQLMIGGVAAPHVTVGLPTASNGVQLNLGQNTIDVAGITATTTQIGVVELADNSETIAGTATDRANTPASLAAKLGTQTQFAVPYGGGATAAVNWLAPLANGQLVIGSTGVAPVAAALTAGAGTTITNGAGSITIASTSSHDNWSFISASQALVANNSYVCIAPGGALSLSLPATAAQGTMLNVSLDGATSFAITQGAGQQIRFGNLTTTAGAGGSLSSAAQGDSVTMVCTVADTSWLVVAAVGNLSVV